MNRQMKILLFGLLLAVTTPSAAAEDLTAPWGRAAVAARDYAPQKVLYDVSVSSREAMTGVLDRVSYLNNIYHADPFASSIVVVLHGDEIPFFAVKNYEDNRELMRRAQSLTVAGPIEFRMCEQAAKSHGFQPGDIHGFVKMVPMADAEIVKLQQGDGYAYMQ